MRGSGRVLPHQQGARRGRVSEKGRGDRPPGDRPDGAGAAQLAGPPRHARGGTAAYHHILNVIQTAILFADSYLTADDPYDGHRCFPALVGKRIPSSPPALEYPHCLRYNVNGKQNQRTCQQPQGESVASRTRQQGALWARIPPAWGSTAGAAQLAGPPRHARGGTAAYQWRLSPALLSHTGKRAAGVATGGCACG